MYTFETPRPVRLRVEAGAGEVRVSAEQVERTTVEVTPLDSTVESQQAIEETTVDQSGDIVDVRVPRIRRGLFRGQPKLAVHVVVPEESSVSTKSESADVSLLGTYARVDLASGSGDLSVESATDRVVAKSGSGDIFAGRCEGPLRVVSGSGDIEVEQATARSSLHTGSGTIHLTSGQGVVDTKSGSGDVVVDSLDGMLVGKTGSGDVEVRAARSGKISAGTGSGDISVGVVRGTAVWLDLNTVTGDVSNQLDDVDDPDEMDLRLELRTKTASGDIAIHRS